MSDAKEKQEFVQDVSAVLSEGNHVNAKEDELHDSLSVPAEATPNSCEKEIDSPETRVQEIVPLEDNLDKQTTLQQSNQISGHSLPMNYDQELDKPVAEPASDVKSGPIELPPRDLDAAVSSSPLETVQSSMDAKSETFEMPEIKTCSLDDASAASHDEPVTPHPVSSCVKAETENAIELKVNEDIVTTPHNGDSNMNHSFILDENHIAEGSESGTEEEQSAFMKELENFFRERSLEFKPPKFYGEGLNCLKLWRAVTRLGGYDKVTSCKLWRQVGESFKPPKTCTTVSWTFRGFYEKALLDYERHKTNGGELSVPIASNSEPMSIENQGSGSGRARRDAAARAMQGWHSQRLLGNGEVSDPIIKDKNSLSMQKREKQLKSIGLLKRKKPSYMEHAMKSTRTKSPKPQLDVAVVDIGQPADWVKVNVQKTKDCYEVYALVPGLLREEVRVQSDPAGRLVISGEPEHPDNPWGVTPFKKVVSLPSRIDPHQTSAVVTLHGQLFVRVPFEQLE
ncbi:AT-rich interactive domain-containing protein 3-like [Cucumis melo var. makuwa]|uniref:AT-rich interactive domain-containing protein 3-like n=2 Tax=Cucumis melo TaxID=3656 RepID=A0A5D3CLR0_CUCMM|nr:AT-rich interactive domain-containing protein 3-like [Cucumis melo var. makuwa]TYK11356.1 AT-rich interactive domain-containing protein 3-like [Cucumis melo var. makuwa]